MNGLLLQRELQRTGCEVPIVFISGEDDPTTRHQAIEGGAVDFLLKPFEDVALLAAVERAIARSDRSHRP
jgi:FixJ family two-component response regulator